MLQNKFKITLSLLRVLLLHFTATNICSPVYKSFGLLVHFNQMFLNVLFFLPSSDVEEYKMLRKPSRLLYRASVWRSDHKLGADFRVRSGFIFYFITFEVKTKFASMGKNKSFSRSLYSPLQKQIHMISILPNRELLKHSIMKCGGTVCNFINAYFFCGTTFSESVDHMGFLIPQSYY